MVGDVVAVEFDANEVPVVDLDGQGTRVSPALPLATGVHVELVCRADLRCKSKFIDQIWCHFWGPPKTIVVESARD